MQNKEIADIFNEIADMLGIEETKTSKFEVRAYRNAALTIGTLQEPIEDIYRNGGIEALMKLPGIGKGLAEKIVEYIDHGKISKYEDLKKRYPINFSELTQLEGMGAKRAVILYKSIGVKDIASLSKAIEGHKIRDLPGFGEKSEALLKESIKLHESSKGRILLGDALPVAESMIAKMKESGMFKKVVLAGSARRMRETVGDIDILAISNKPEKGMDYFVSMEDVEKVIVRGPTKSTVWLKVGTSCDLRVIKPESFGAAQQYFIGSKEHNIEVRKIAIKKGYKLNEYGLFGANNRIIASSDESEIYAKLGMEYPYPEMREARGEVELALEHKLPKLVELQEIKGDMHTHTLETDGANTIEEMAEAAMQNGLEYFATTNHTKSLKIAHGMNDRQFLEFFKKVDKLNEKLAGKVTILKGAEIDILKDGKLDLDAKTIKAMDCPIGAVHSFFNMDKEAMTKRVIKAMDSGMMRILAHPTGRVINEREGYDIDLERIAEAAERDNVILEINSFPNRLDLNDTNILRLSKYKVMFSIDTDSHRTSHFKFLRYGVGTARRGWLEKGRVLNTRDASAVMKLFGGNK
ncbi:MAG: DNA polymerase/3'-5' exonuclease PolX [Candidatus Micrarchaeaceae archaeon]